MSAIKTKVYSSFDEVEAGLLHDFKKEAFYFTGEELQNYNFWQQFLNLFFIYHYNVGNGQTPAIKRGLEPAEIRFFVPSVFSKLKGEDFFAGDKMVLAEDEENTFSWYKDKDCILSFFHEREDGFHFVESQSSLLISRSNTGFFKKLRTAYTEESMFQSKFYLLFLISLLMIKKERFSSSKLYDPFKFEEIEKLHLYYESKFSDIIV
ncbi:MAG TPA: hypothetical protein ENN58_03955 [bacterium]|nr:hypothetical protein [bacterium]